MADRRIASAILVALAATSAFAMLWLLKYSGRGFSFSDEGFYLNWMAQPGLYKYSTTQFGFIYRPLYELVGSNVAYLRSANLVLSFGLALEVGALVFRRLGNGPYASAAGPAPAPWPKWWCYALAAPVALVACSMPHSWLPMPSYNTLVTQAFLVTVLGILHLPVHGAKVTAAWGAACLIATGLWMSGMAKPPSAALLTIAIFTYIAATHRLSWRLFWTVTLLTATFLLLSMLWIDGSVPGFIARLRGGMQISALMGAGHGLGELTGRFFTDQFSFSRTEWVVGLLALAISALVTRCGMGRTTIGHRCAWLAGLALILAAAAILWTDTDLPYQWASFEWLLICFPVIGCVLGRSGLSAPKTRLPTAESYQGSEIPAWKRDTLALGILLVLLPHFSAFGSNNNVWLQGGYSAVFWALGGIVLASCVRPRLSPTPLEWLPAAAAMQLIAVAVLSVTITHPYLQTESLRLQRTPVTLHGGTSTLSVTADMAAYLNGLQKTALNAGFQPGDVVIDMTGFYAASLFALGAKPVGSAWLIGGWKGAEAAAQAALDLVPCEQMAKAWLLVSPSGPIHLPDDVLVRYGLQPAANYESVGTIKAPWPIPGQYFDQQLMRPQRPLEQALNLCKSAKMPVK
jgi:hypothetical protein